MDRKYPLEALLISRSHSAAKTIELLEQRYAVNDKPTLSLRPTESVPTEKKNKKQPNNKGLLTTIRESQTTQQSTSSKKTKKTNKPQHKDQTKLVFKQYIQRCLHYQQIIKHKAHRLSKETKEVNVDYSQFKEFKHIPQFDQFLTLNKLWTKYIQDLLSITKTTLDKATIQQTLTKLASADFNGCFLRVLKSKNKQCVGKSGIVIWDSKNFFIIVESDSKVGGGLKMLEKKGSIFNFVVPIFDLDNEEIDDNDDNYLEFSIIGSRFQYRSADRAGRKFKSRNVDDL